MTLLDHGGYGEIHSGPGETVYKTGRGDEWGLGDHGIIREAAALQVLAEDPGVIDLLGFGTCEGRPWIRLPRIWWPTLREARVPWPACLGVWAEVADAIRRGHALGIVHRDVKPGNVFLTPEGPLVFDYGLCHIQGQPDFPIRRDYCLGTPHCMAPEVILDEDHAPGPEQDHYQLGVLLHWLCEGEQPIPGETSVEVMRNACAGARLPMVGHPELERARDWLMDDRDLVGATRIVSATSRRLRGGS